MMATRKKPTAAQLAARKLFAQRAKAGTLKKTARKTVRQNPSTTKRRGPSKVNAPSQLTGKPPTKRLKARRKKNVRAGVFPNPSRAHSAGFRYKVQVSLADATGPWKTVATFAEKDRAHEYAKALNRLQRYKAIRVYWV